MMECSFSCCSMSTTVPSKHVVRIPTGSKASIILSVREGEGMYCMYTGVYTATSPSGSLRSLSIAFSTAAKSRLPPALSPTTTIFSAVVPTNMVVRTLHDTHVCDTYVM